MTITRRFPPLGIHLRTVHSGNSALSGTLTEVTIPQVSLARSALLFTFGGGAYMDGVRGEIVNGTTIRFTGVSLLNTIARWFVIEFRSGVTVQRGAIASAPSSADIAILPVNLVRSFPIVSAFTANSNPADGRSWMPDAAITNSTTLRLRRGPAYEVHGGPGTWSVAWQVVSLD